MTWSISGLGGSCELLFWGTVSWHVHSDDLIWFRFGRFLWIVILGHCQLTCSFWWLGLFQVWEVPVNCYFGALSADMFILMTWSGSGLGGSCELLFWGTVSWHVHSDDLVCFRFGRFLWIVILGHCQLTCSFWWLGLVQVWEVPVNCLFGQYWLMCWLCSRGLFQVWEVPVVHQLRELPGDRREGPTAERTPCEAILETRWVFPEGSQLSLCQCTPQQQR